MPTYDVKQLASHYLSLNAARANYWQQGLLLTYIKITVWGEDLHLRPYWIWTLEFRKVQDAKWVDVDQQKVNNHVYEEYIDSVETMFAINKAIFTKLNSLITFDLSGEQAEYGIYL